jgi:hypothetical protein
MLRKTTHKKLFLRRVALLLFLFSAVLMSGCAKNHSGLTSISLTPDETPQDNKPAPTIEPFKCTPHPVPDFFWGVTATNVNNVAEITEALKDLGKAFPDRREGELPPIIVRVTFNHDESNKDFLQNLKKYQYAVSQISQYAYVMGEIADSDEWWPYLAHDSDQSTSGHNNYRARTKQLVETMGDCVQVWEIGNEVNGEWAGSKHEPFDNSDSMRRKIGKQIAEAYDEVQKYNKLVPPERQKKTALTVYYNDDGENDCLPGHKEPYAMLTWARADYIPAEVKDNLNYVLISYYENKKDCPGLKQEAKDFVKTFGDLAGIFRHAKLGFGEVGYKATCPEDDNDDSTRVNSLECICGKASCPSKDYCIGQANYLTKYYLTFNRNIIDELKRQKAPFSFVGGYFYWYFVQDMTGKNQTGDDANQKRNRAILKQAMNSTIK